MPGKKKDPNKEYSPNWGGKRPGSGGKPGWPAGHGGGRKKPEIPKRQRHVYVTDAEFTMLKDYLWNVLRKDAPQANRKHKTDTGE